ncbi:hypothetical protein GCM10020254_33760 [Streptomyces goshikiensis]
MARYSLRVVSSRSAVRGSSVTPQSPGDELDQRGQPGGGGGDVRPVGAPRLAADVQRLVPQTVPLVEQQELEAPQFLARDVAPPGERVVPGREEYEVLVEQGQFADPGHPQGYGEQQQVEPPAGQPLQQRGGLLLVHLEVHAGVAPVEQPEHRRQQVRGHRGDHPEAQHAGEGRPYRLGLLQQPAHGVEHHARAGGDPLARRGEQHLAGGALQQLDAEGLLQRGDRSGERRLAHADGGGRVAEVQVFRDGHEGAQLRERRLLESSITDSH